MAACCLVAVGWGLSSGRNVRPSGEAPPPTPSPEVEGLQGTTMAEIFTRHRQPWKSEEVAKLRTLAGKGKGLKEIAKALNRSEESTKERAKEDGIGIAKLR